MDEELHTWFGRDQVTSVFNESQLTRMPRYIYDYVFDVYDTSGRYTATGHPLFSHDKKATFADDAYARNLFPGTSVVPRPTMCTCVACGAQTKVDSFRTLVPLHVSSCKLNTQNNER